IVARSLPPWSAHGLRYRNSRPPSLAWHPDAMASHRCLVSTGRNFAFQEGARQRPDHARAHDAFLRHGGARADAACAQARADALELLSRVTGMRKRGHISETTEIQVAFHDVDLMAVVWHGHYFKYLETARWQLMDRLGYGFAAMRDSGYLWPIIETRMRHMRSAAYGDRLAVTA